MSEHFDILYGYKIMANFFSRYKRDCLLNNSSDGRKINRNKSEDYKQAKEKLLAAGKITTTI